MWPMHGQLCPSIIGNYRVCPSEQFLGALRLGQARGPGAAATSVTDQLTLVQKYVSSIGH